MVSQISTREVLNGSTFCSQMDQLLVFKCFRLLENVVYTKHNVF